MKENKKETVLEEQSNNLIDIIANLIKRIEILEGKL